MTNPRVIQVIESYDQRGGGNPQSPLRLIRQYHTCDGKFLAEEQDMWEQHTPKINNVKESFMGADASGSNGSINRTVILKGVGGINIPRGGVLRNGKHLRFDLINNKVRFLERVFNTEVILINYCQKHNS